jgi:hypothetical protein
MFKTERSASTSVCPRTTAVNTVCDRDDCGDASVVATCLPGCGGRGGSGKGKLCLSATVGLHCCSLRGGVRGAGERGKGEIAA